MDRRRRLLERLRGGHLHNVDFTDFCNLLEGLGFSLERSKGSHFSFTHPSLRRAFPVQPRRGQAKPKQLKQLLKLIDGYNLTLEK